MYQRLKTLIKDLLIFVAFIFLVSILVKRLRKYIKVHKGSLIHELDLSFFDALKTVQRHAGILKQVLNADTTLDQDNAIQRQVKLIRKQIHDIEQKYTRNAPPIALLGPIGTTSIVLKEKQLKQRLKNTALSINAVFAELLDKAPMTKEKQRSIELNDLIKLNTQYAKETQRLP